MSDRPAAEPAAARFRLLERLGGGGAGEVYRAEDRLLGREVALKVLREGADGQGDAAREARRLAALSHPAIAGIYELVRLPDGRSALVMERVDGPELAAALASGPLPVEEALGLGIELARALAYAHGRGVVHGDLKPANVLLPSAGAPKLVDFGFGRLAGDGGDPGEPESGAAGGLGTLGYAAPERLRGAPPDAPSDLFSLGCLLYHAVAGRAPFAGGSAREVVEATLRHEPLPLGALRPETPFLLDRAIRRLLAKEPAARPGSAEEAAAELEAIRAGRPRPGREADQAAPGPAFRGLLSFQEVDAAAFFGREQDLRGLVAMVTSPERRFAVLHGESGCGKTSLVRAGLIPRLRAAGWLALYSRVYQAPVDALVAAAGREAGLAAVAGAGEPPHRVLERVATAVGAPVLVVLDQFEEAFTTLPPEERERLVALVASCQGGEPAGVRFLVSVRSDFLHLVGEAFDRSVREPLAVAGRYRLRSFTREQAEEVLARSAGAGELPADPDLWPVVAADLLDQGRVLPSELQIAGQEIQRRRLLSAREYRRSGGKTALVEGFLDDVLAGSGDVEAARRLLSALISPEGTRLPSTREEIRARSGLEAAAVERVLELLVGSRLVRPLQDASGTRFELVHEYLVARIEALGRGELTRAERADRALRRHLGEHSADPGARIPIRRLWPIYRHAEWRSDDAARRLLAASARRAAALAAAAALALVIAAAALATPFAIREEWAGQVLADAHRAPARQAAFSPDGRRLASVGEDGRVLVWDFPGRVVLAELSGHNGYVETVAFSPDGRWLATGGRDGRALVWDARTLARVTEIAAHPAPVTFVGFTPDATLLATAYDGPAAAKGVVLWRVGSWETAGEIPWRVAYGTLVFPGPRSVISAVSGEDGVDLAGGGRFPSPFSDGEGFNWIALSPDGSIAAAVEAGGRLRVGPADSRGAPRWLPAHEDHARSVAFSPDGRWLATAAEDIVLWDPATLTKVQRLSHSAVVWHLAFSPDGRRLVSSHTDGDLLIWDLPERRLEASLAGHSGPVRGVTFSPDGALLATAGDDRTVILWRVADGRKLAVFQGHRTRVSGVDFSDDGRRLASCDQAGGVVVWDVAARSLRARFDPPADGKNRMCYGLAVAPGGQWIAAGQGLFDPEARQLRYFYDEDLPSSTTVYPVRFSPDGRWLARGSDQGVLQLRNAGFDRVAQRQDVGPPGLNALDFSPDGERLIVGDGAGELWLYTRQPLERVALLGRHEARVKAAVFSPAGRRIASASDDGRILLWDVRRRELVATLASLGNPVLALDFSRDGSLLAAGTHDGTVRLYALRRTVWGLELGRDEEGS